MNVMNTKKIFSVLFTFLGVGLILAQNPGTGFGELPAPIDTYEVVLIIVAVLLTVGVVAYKKLSIKKV